MSSIKIESLYIHPVKSCAALSQHSALLTEFGLQYDREWMVVDNSGEFISQREYPRMALVRCEFKLGDLILRAPGMMALHLRLDGAESETRVRVWDDEMPAFDMGDLAGQWFSDFLGVTGLRLAAFDNQSRRLSSARYSSGIEAPNTFTDGFPLLVISEASLDELNRRLAAAGHAPVGMTRFRPNIVLSGIDTPHGEDQIDTLTIDDTDADGAHQGAHTDEKRPVVLKLTKPCPRCPMPDIDPDTAVMKPTVSPMLQAYRSHPLLDGAVAFGMNAVIVSGVGARLRQGQWARALINV